MPFYIMPDQEKLFVRRFGQGQPVLVLSGLGMQSWQWLPFLLSQHKQYEFIIPDWRGFGASKNCKIPTLDAISSHWQDVNTLITQLNLKQFKLIAYSMGATTAMHGMKYGDLSAKLSAYLHIDQTPKILVDETWQYGLFGTQHFQFKSLLVQIHHLLSEYQHIQKLEDLTPHVRSCLVRLWCDFIELQSNNPYSPKIFKLALKRPFLQKYLLPLQRLDYLFWYVDNYLHHDEDYLEAISQLTCPTTFFIGRESTLYPEVGQTLVANRLANAKAVYFEHSGHAPLITEPKKFSQEIGIFLQAC